MTDHDSKEDLIEEIRRRMRDLSPETGGLLMMQYDIEEPEGTFFYYEILALDGVHIEYWTDKEEIPKEEEELLSDILDGDFENWDSIDEELLVDYLDFLKSEPEET